MAYPMLILVYLAFICGGTGGGAIVVGKDYVTHAYGVICENPSRLYVLCYMGAYGLAGAIGGALSGMICATALPVIVAGIIVKNVLVADSDKQFLVRIWNEL